MTIDAALAQELARRLQAFFDELRADQAWDSEFNLSPHAPALKMAHLVELGPVVVPTLVDLCRSTQRDERFHAILGLQSLGSACGPEGLGALEVRGLSGEGNVAQPPQAPRLLAFFFVGARASRRYTLDLSPLLTLTGGGRGPKTVSSLMTK